MDFGLGKYKKHSCICENVLGTGRKIITNEVAMKQVFHIGLEWICGLGSEFKHCTKGGGVRVFRTKDSDSTQRTSFFVQTSKAIPASGDEINERVHTRPQVHLMCPSHHSVHKQLLGRSPCAVLLVRLYFLKPSCKAVVLACQS